MTLDICSNKDDEVILYMVGQSCVNALLSLANPQSYDTKVLNHVNTTMVMVQSMQILGNMLTCSDSIVVEHAMNQKILDVMYDVIEKLPGIRKNALWLVSNIAADNLQYSTKIIDHQIFESVKDEYMHGPIEHVRGEAIYVMYNMLRVADEECKKFLVKEHNFMEMMAEYMKVLPTCSPELVKIELMMAYCLLQHGKDSPGLYEGQDTPALRFQEAGGDSILQDAQDHTNQEIYHLAV